MEDGKIYSGWEVIKLLSERKLGKGDNLRDNKGNIYKVGCKNVNALLISGMFRDYEVGNSIFAEPDRKFYKVIR